MKRELTTHAAAAKMIRAEMKKRGIKGRVKSRSYSMGNSVDVYLLDERPATVEAVRGYVDQFQYGHFDGMLDLYEYSNKRDDIPQVKFTTVRGDYSDEMKQRAWDYFRDWHAGYDDMAASYAEASRWNYVISNEVHRVLTGAQGDFWGLAFHAGVVAV